MTAIIEAANLELNDGEIYAGAIIAPDGTGHHVILLPGDNDDTDWNAQMEWAKSIGGDLPDHVEQAMLFGFLKYCFKEEWYWSNTQHASYSDYAWLQSFDDSYRGYYRKSRKYRARAVRRVTFYPSIIRRTK